MKTHSHYISFMRYNVSGLTLMPAEKERCVNVVCDQTFSCHSQVSPVPPCTQHIPLPDSSLIPCILQNYLLHPGKSTVDTFASLRFSLLLFLSRFKPTVPSFIFPDAPLQCS